VKQLYKSIIILLLIAAAFLSLTTCGAFFITELPRTNPYDEEALVAPIENLDAHVLNGNTIELTWQMPEERKPSSLIIVKNETQNPRNTGDGIIYNGIDPASGAWEDTDAAEDITYYYGVWSVADDGTEVGPIYTLEEIISRTLTLEPDDDGYTDDTPITNFNGNFMWVERSAAITGSIALFQYDFTELPEIIETAELEINVTTVTTAGATEIFKITESWNSLVAWAQSSPTSFYNNAPPIGGFLANSSDIFMIDVKDTVLEMQSGNNYGFLIRPVNGGDMDIQIGTVEDSTPPILNVIGYDEKYTDD